MDEAAIEWAIVVPLKRLALAKSRLGPPFERIRPELVLAFALDTVAAALAAERVAGVTVVTDEREAGRRLRDLGAYVVGDVPDAGLNPALEYGAAVAATTFPGAGLGALSADLPALRPTELAAACARAAAHPASFVPDAVGTGTTVVLARSGIALTPAFGPDSADRHRALGHAELPAEDLPSLRRDVDTAADLEAAAALGLGAHTVEVLRRHGLPLAGSR